MMDPASTSNIPQENGGSRKERDKIPLCTIHKFHSLILTVNIPIFYSSINLPLMLVLQLLPIKSGKKVTLLQNH